MHQMGSKINGAPWLLLALLCKPFLAKADLADEPQEKPVKASKEAVKAQVSRPLKKAQPIKAKEPEPAIQAVPQDKPRKKSVAKSDEAERKLPISYTGESLFGSKTAGKIQIEKNVKVEQGDLSLKADMAEIFFLRNEDSVDKVAAKGNVLMDKTDIKTGKLIKASGNYAEYDAKKEVVLIKGEARLERGADLIQGTYIRYDLKTGGIEAGKVAGVVAPGEPQ